MSGPDVAGLIDRLGTASLEAKRLISELHTATKDARQARRELEELMKRATKQEVDERVGQLVKKELDKLGPKMRDFSCGIYERIGAEVDRLIDLAMGEEFARDHNRSSVRPQLAAKIKEWLKEQIDPELVKPELLLDTEHLGQATPCPHCLAPHNGITLIANKVYQRPKLGDYMVCTDCAGIAVWKLSGWHKPTDQEMAIALSDEGIVKAVKVITRRIESERDDSQR